MLFDSAAGDLRGRLNRLGRGNQEQKRAQTEKPPYTHGGDFTSGGYVRGVTDESDFVDGQNPLTVVR